MKILVTGSGTSGSWTVRGEQIGRAMGATVKPRAELADMRAADVVLVVKRCPVSLHAALLASGRPWAYDIVDAYPQPGCNAWSGDESVAWLLTLLARLQPTTVIWPNHCMRRDGGGAGVVVPHHGRPGIARNPIRERITLVGYEGSARYLDGGLAEAIEAQCRARGARFVINPAQLADVDVVVALRSAYWHSYAASHWKSGVKLANAHASGTPFIGARECGYEEIATGAEHWADSPTEIGDALDALAPQEARAAIARRFLASTLTVEEAAERIRAVLESILDSRESSRPCALRS
jgi:hypothetical protein